MGQGRTGRVWGRLVLGRKLSRQGLAWGGANFWTGSVWHTFQEMSGCIVGLDWHFLRGYTQFAYDGTDYIALNEDLSSWTTADTAARITWRNLVQVEDADHRRRILESTWVHWIHLFLENEKEMLLRAGSRARAPKGADLWAGAASYKERGKMGPCQIPLLLRRGKRPPGTLIL